MIKRYKCVVVANGLFPTGQQALELLRQAEFVVACDGAVIGLENGRLSVIWIVCRNRFETVIPIGFTG